MIIVPITPELIGPPKPLALRLRDATAYCLAHGWQWQGDAQKGLRPPKGHPLETATVQIYKDAQGRYVCSDALEEYENPERIAFLRDFQAQKLRTQQRQE